MGYVATVATLILKLLDALKVPLLDGSSNHTATGDEEHVGRQIIFLDADLVGSRDGGSIEPFFDYQQLRARVIPRPAHGAVECGQGQAEHNYQQDAPFAAAEDLPDFLINAKSQLAGRRSLANR